jgi:hypothetical protein
VPRAGNLRLDQKQVGARIGRDFGVMPRRGRCGRHRRNPARRLDAVDERPNQLVANRLRIRLGQDRCRRVTALRRGDPLDDRRRILVAGVQPLEVHERQATMACHLHRELGVRDGVHRRGDERDSQT